MPLMDEFREEREQIKKAPFPQKVQYFRVNHFSYGIGDNSGSFK